MEWSGVKDVLKNVCNKYNMSAKDLKDKLKALRSAHVSKAIGKMSAEEIASEINHHETAVKARETKAKRLAALAAAREAKKKAPEILVAEIPKKEFIKEHKKLVKVLETGTKKAQKKEAVEQKKELKKAKYVADDDSEMSSTDDETDTETIKSRIQKKRFANDE
jgi:hypothetical protein